MGNAFNIWLRGETVCLRLDESLYQFKDIWDCKRHSNAGYELHIILSGSCGINVGHDHYCVNHHQAVLIAPGEYHQPMPLGQEFERFSCSFTITGDALPKQFSEVLSKNRLFSVPEEVVGLCRSIFDECEKENDYRGEMIQSLLSVLLLRVFRQINLADKQEEEFGAIGDSEQINKIDTFFEMNYAENAKAETLAEQLFMTRRQLGRVLEKYYQMGFREKLIHTRMDLAAWRLVSTNKSVSEIAFEVGYNSEAAFYQSFRKQFEMTPAEYRAAFMQDA